MKESPSGYYSMHVRRGDFQWAAQRLSPKEWLEAAKRSNFMPDTRELLYIATDEVDLSFFDVFREHYTVRFLSDYKELAGFDNLDPNFVGQIDQVVCVGGKDFLGTYFSSFTAYIGRLRGYHKISGKRMYYSKQKK